MGDTNLSVSECSNLSSGKKRVLNVEQWRDKNLKALRNAGKEYVNKRGKGKIVAAKEAPVQVRGCQVNCSKIEC